MQTGRIKFRSGKTFVFARDYNQYYRVPEAHWMTPGVRALSDHGYSRAKHSSSFCFPYWVLDYVKGDISYYAVGGEPRVRRRMDGTLHLYPPGLRFREQRKISGRFLAGSFITFDGGDRLNLTRLVNNSRGCAEIFDPGRIVGAILERAPSKCLLFGETGWMTAQKYLYEIAAILQNVKPVYSDWQFRLETEFSGDFVSQVRALLLDSIEKHVSVRDLAVKLGCSVSSLEHNYRKLAGETVWQTFIGFRLEAALALLGGRKSLREIAGMTGFCDEYHLSRCFVRKYGVAPGRWRRGNA